MLRVPLGGLDVPQRNMAAHELLGNGRRPRSYWFWYRPKATALVALDECLHCRKLPRHGTGKKDDRPPAVRSPQTTRGLFMARSQAQQPDRHQLIQVIGIPQCYNAQKLLPIAPGPVTGNRYGKKTLPQTEAKHFVNSGT